MLYGIRVRSNRLLHGAVTAITMRDTPPDTQARYVECQRDYQGAIHRNKQTPFQHIEFILLC